MNKGPETPYKITCSLNRQDGVYSFQEHVVLDVAVRNNGDSAMRFPSVRDRKDVFIDLKNLDDGREGSFPTYIDYPGMPYIPETSPVAPGEEILWHLVLNGRASLLDHGRFEASLRIEADEIAYTSDVFPFTVLEPGADVYAAAPSTYNLPQSVYVLWADHLASPPRLINRRYFFGREEELVMSSAGLAQAPDSVTSLASSTSSGENDADQRWTAYISKGALHCLAHSETATEKKDPVPLAGEGTIVSPLLCHPDSTLDRSAMSLALAEQNGPGSFVLRGLHFGDGGTPLSQHSAPLPGEPKPAAAAHLSEDRMWVMYAYAKNEALQGIVLQPWSSKDGFGEARPVMDIPARIYALALHPSGNKLIGAVAAWMPPEAESPYAGGALVRFQWTQGEKILMGGTPKTTGLEFPEQPFTAGAACDEEGGIWVWVKDVHGVTVFSPEDPMTPVMVQTPAGSYHEKIYFNRHNVPGLLYYDPEKGWTTIVLSADE
ncbi:hypothetical protein ACFL5V_12210 [Fibrobacterota bacterium]